MAETPIIYTWQATDQTDVIHTDGEISDSVSFTWNTPGIKELTVTADNAEGTFSCIHNVDVRELQISDIRQIDDRIELTLSGTSSYSKYEILYRNGTDEWQIVSLPIRGEDGLTIWEDYQRTDSEIDSYKAVTTDDIAIASFNIMRFTKKKSEEELELMQILANIISRFDIVTIQEIIDKSGNAVENLKNMINDLGTNYDYIMGPPLGNTSYKEEYAYMYRTDTITVTKRYTFGDIPYNIFEREPFVAKFSANNGKFDFVLINIHTKPDEDEDKTAEEIASLLSVIEDARTEFADESDFIILGDLNADCDYFDEYSLSSPLKDDEYNWLITNGMDTNLASSRCTYDRIIITSDSEEDYAGYSSVFRFDQKFGLTYNEATAQA